LINFSELKNIQDTGMFFSKFDLLSFASQELKSIKHLGSQIGSYFNRKNSQIDDKMKWAENNTQIEGRNKNETREREYKEEIWCKGI